MKLHANHSNIERGGVHSETSFTIKTNALSFSILSSGLYTDPIMAIIRELSCNAYDAHTAANNAATPFEIHLPNELEPFLSIKDFGTGLSDADIQGEIVPVEAKDGTITHPRTGGLYTTYFDSTKTKSNEYIGALGLGSKSPFSYSEAFEVISRFEGTKRTYAIFLNEDGIPTVALMGKIETDEHSGLEIKISIKSEDFRTFHSRTATALKFFKVQPIVKGALNFEFDVIPKHRIETQNWMLSRSMGYYNSSVVAVQGNVQYRVDSAQIQSHLLHDLQTFISKTNIVLFFDIGDVEVAANREEIRYDKRSIEAIVAGVNEVYANLTPEIEARIGTVDAKYWDACIILNALSSELFSNVNFIIDHANAESVKSNILQKYISNRGQVMFDGMYGYDLYHYKLKTLYTSTSVKRTSLSGTFSPQGNVAIIINDVKTCGIKRLTYFLENDSEFKEAFLITKRKKPLDKFDACGDLVPYIGFDEELETFKNQLGNPEVLLISEITSAETKKSNSTKKTPYYMYDGIRIKHNNYYNQSHMLSWTYVSKPVEDGGIYIPLKYGKSPAIYDVNGKLEPITDAEPKFVDEALNFIIKLYNDKHGTSYNYCDLYGLPASTCKVVKNSDNWINLYQFAEDILPEFSSTLHFYYKHKATDNFAGLKSAIAWSGFVAMVQSLTASSSFKKALMPLIDSNNKHSNDEFDNLKILARVDEMFTGCVRALPTPFFNQETFDEYGMLTMINDIQYNTDWNALKQYIKMIDGSK